MGGKAAPSRVAARETYGHAVINIVVIAGIPRGVVAVEGEFPQMQRRDVPDLVLAAAAAVLLGTVNPAVSPAIAAVRAGDDLTVVVERPALGARYRALCLEA